MTNEKKDITSLPLWNVTGTESSLSDCFNHSQFTTAEKIMNMRESNIGIEETIEENTGYELRMSLLVIAKRCEELNGMITGPVLFQNKEQTHGIVLVIRAIRKQSTETPVFQVDWMALNKTSPNFEQAINIIPKLMQEGPSLQVNSSAKEIQLLKEVLERNQNSEISIYELHKPNHPSFMFASYISPLGKSNTEDFAHIMQKREKWCEADGCDAKGLMKCSSCQAVYYCSQSCQRSHWRSEHKAICRAAKEALENNQSSTPSESAEATAAASNAKKTRNRNRKKKKTNGKAGIMTTTIATADVCDDDNDDSGSIVIPSKSSTAPPFISTFSMVTGTAQGTDGKKEAVNVHGSKKFVIKIQINTGSSNFGPMMIYDRPKSFHRLYDHTETGYREILKLVQTKGYCAMKIYLWAKREANTFRIYTKDIPTQKQPF